MLLQRFFLERNSIFSGTEVEADAVILATGYIFGFPFLEKGIIEVNSRVLLRQ